MSDLLARLNKVEDWLVFDCQPQHAGAVKDAITILSEQISGEAVERVTEVMVARAHAEYHKVLGDPNRSNPMKAALEAALRGPK